MSLNLKIKGSGVLALKLSILFMTSKQSRVQNYLFLSIICLLPCFLRYFLKIHYKKNSNI